MTHLLILLKRLSLMGFVAFFIGQTLVFNASAEDFLNQARQFLETVGASAEQNQEYIAQSNQFTAEGEFNAQELAELFLIRAIVFSRLRDTQNALESYGFALQSGNLSPILKAEALKNRGLLFYADTSYLEAKNDFSDALNILSGNAELHYYLANSLFGLLEFDQALQQYDQALEGMANNRFLAYYGKASVFYHKKNLDKSIENLNKSLESRNDFEPAITLMAEIEALDNQDNIPPEPVADSDAEINLTGDSELTANQIYNQLLEKAFAAQQASGGNKPAEIKLGASQEKTPVSTANTQKIQPKKIRIPAEVELRQPNNNMNFGSQISNLPFMLDNQNQPKRLDSLLGSVDSADNLKGFFVQLSSSRTKKTAQKHYDEMIAKHGLLLSKRPYIVREFVSKTKNVKFQLLIAGFESYKQANSLCKFIKAQNSECFIRQIK